MTRCLISFGANIPGPFGEPRETLSRAQDELAKHKLILTKVSKLYSSVAFPDTTEPNYINGCLEITVDCTPDEVLDRLKNIEKKLGRKKKRRWSSRICDLDLLSFSDIIMPSHSVFNAWCKMSLRYQIIRRPNELIIPHPRLQDRAFVLKPLMDVASDWIHPVFNISVSEMIKFLPEHELETVIPV